LKASLPSRCFIAALFLIAALSAHPVLADITGPVIVTDGDSIKIDGQRIRIHGIDAPEARQACTYTNGEEWPCGSVATAFMSHLVANNLVTCEQRDVDRYGRIVAVCHAGATDVGKAMVYYGLALAYRRYSSDYVATEDGAREARRGMWQGAFVEPWEWRKAQR
jgi:endonuclease YncB( thermonuclease family)